MCTHRVMSLHQPTPSSSSIVPPKSHSTTSPGRITRPPASWCGLAAFSPAATMAKFTCWWPSSTMRRPRSAETSASVRPASGIFPACRSAAMRSTAAAARRRASTSAGSFTARSGPVTTLAFENRAAGSATCRSSTNRAQV